MACHQSIRLTKSDTGSLQGDLFTVLCDILTVWVKWGHTSDRSKPQVACFVSLKGCCRTAGFQIVMGLALKVSSCLCKLRMAAVRRTPKCLAFAAGARLSQVPSALLQQES